MAVPKRGKRVSPQTLIGEGGVSMISCRVNEMGFLYHDRRVDHGIDGEIELVADGDALNQVIMVQSKASNRPHAFETADSFQWTPRPEDLDYWLGGNAVDAENLIPPGRSLLISKSGVVGSGADSGG
jgi:hypothetical protein